MRTLQLTFLCVCLCIAAAAKVKYTATISSKAFPVTWNADKNRNSTCIAKNIPNWLDGIFFCQTLGSYGDQKAPPGEKLVHMFDGISAVTTFDFHDAGKVDFQAKYYPTRTYKIWDFYERDLSKSKVAWGTFGSVINEQRFKEWEKLAGDYWRFAPNVDFWKVGPQIVAATEFVQVGMQFHPETLDNFDFYPFKGPNETYFNGQVKGLVPFQMPVHERSDPDGTLWASSCGFDFSRMQFFQNIFSVTPEGVRNIRASAYFPGRIDVANCDAEGNYLGDHFARASYMHSITSTKNYVILPMTSILVNPCVFGPKRPIQDTFTAKFQWEGSVPLRFLIFDKRTNTFTTTEPMKHSIPLMTMHQFNAYEVPGSDGVVIHADMTAFDHLQYNEEALEYLLAKHDHEQTWEGDTLMLRFIINVAKGTIDAKMLNRDGEMVFVEFPQVNHNFDGLPYKYGYFVEKWFSTGNSIAKIDVSDPNIPWKRFTPGSTVGLTEPWFVQTPGSTTEDDGVIVVKGFDTSIDKSRVYVVDAKTMKEIGHAMAPVLVPLGLHNRYYSRAELGLKPTNARAKTEL